MWFRFEATVKNNFKNRECGSPSCAKDFESCCLSVYFWLSTKDYLSFSHFWCS